MHAPRPETAETGRLRANESTWQKENAMSASFDDEDPPVRNDEEPAGDGPNDPPGVRIDPDDPLLHDLRKAIFAHRAEWLRLGASWDETAEKCGELAGQCWQAREDVERADARFLAAIMTFIVV